MKNFSILLLITILMSINAQSSWGADTLEPYGKGSSAYELYTNYNGIGQGKYGKEISGLTQLGFGLTDRISAYVNFSSSSNEYYGNSSNGFAYGVFGTIFKSDHVELDLILNFGADMSISPGFELNLDLKPGQAKTGLYIRVFQTFGGTEDSSGTDLVYSRTSDTAGLLGAYLTICPGKIQLLAEFDMGHNQKSVSGEDALTIGGIAVGLNIVIWKNIELINSVYVDIPQNDEKTNFGIGTGIFVTF